MSRRFPKERRLSRRKVSRRATVRALVRVRAGARRRRRRANRAVLTFGVRLRSLARKAFLILWTLFIYVLWMACWPIKAINERPMRPLRRRIHRLWGRGLLWGVGARVTVKGERPEGAFFLVANHLSYIDAFLLAGHVGGAFVARADMAHWPIFGWMMRNAYQVFINREDMRDAARVLGLIDDVLKNDDGIIIFPEAGCTRGTHVRQFRPAMFQVPAARNMPVHCATITYSTPPGYPAAGDDVVWWRHEEFLDHFERCLRLPYFNVELTFAPAPISAPDRKQLAAKTHAEVVRFFVPVTQGVLPELPAPPGVKVFD